MQKEQTEMNGRNASLSGCNQHGFTLIEAMISLALTSLLLLGGMKLATTALFQHRAVNEHYAFWQQMSVASHILRQELHKAGYNGQKGQSARLAGCETILSVSPDHHSLAFTYLKNKEGSEYQTIAYQKKKNQLVLCEKVTSQPVSLNEALASTQMAPCYPVFDSRSITIGRFDAQITVLKNSADVPVLDVLNLTLSASSVMHPELIWSQVIQQPLRNWR
ncbi:prepilin-type N-terminal cleavage/methylation domain-containing protein [Vibrio salinus]|uniref:prepilin-type N-terminal cleavage/methylation domain-containing protein n=1 Tax=Vibrio salinus TaxID=2899784 RepID=UPI001E5DF91C|nr:prepilin-type N-terminal cleavage/methylation domain-containing protein [Vibrio salinus]MCE0493088.1 prepilin-type N-terminal cleavage/methylation domain-containing protein [Vibrio salinus]